MRKQGLTQKPGIKVLATKHGMAYKKGRAAGNGRPHDQPLNPKRGPMSDLIAYEHARRYTENGWKLVAMPAGTKAPTTFGWQTRAADPEHWKQHPTHNMGLLHGLSGTCALDIDDMTNTRLICEALNIDLDAILSTAPRIVGRPDRGKCLFRAPPDLMTTRKLSWPVQGEVRKTSVIFELRAGSVQDVLPPSIHPDTQNPYTWAGPDWRDLPEVPPQLLLIWREWDRFRIQLADLCPWAAPQHRPAPKPRRADQQSVIEAYNAATPIADALESAGYRQIGKRWLSPNSTSNIPGVVIFDDGRAYSHHASDPFDPAHAFDAFDVFAHYQHLGNIGAAVRAAGELLEIERLPVDDLTDDQRESLRIGQAVVALWDANKAAQKGIGIPDALLTVPGILGDVVKYSAATAIRSQPQFDVQAALALGSVIMGRRFITDHENMSSLFFLNVAPTGSGKEHANTVIERLLEAAGLMHLRGPNGYTSAPGVLSALYDKPAHVAIIDEFGAMLTSAQARGNHHKQDALTMIMEAFGRQTATLRNVGYATLGLKQAQKAALDVHVARPSLTLLGMTTPETFFDAIGAKDVASGFLNRFLIVQSRIGRKKARRNIQAEIRSGIIEWMQATASAGESNIVQDAGPEFPPEAVIVPFSARAHELFDQYEDHILAWQEKLPPSGAGMLNRTREIAMRVALIVSRSLGESEISETAAQWAIDYVDFYARETLEHFQANLAEGDTDALRKKVAAAIKSAGGAGLKIRELLQLVPRLGNLRKIDRDGLLAMIVEDYPIERIVQKPPKGRPAIIHRWTDSG